MAAADPEVVVGSRPLVVAIVLLVSATGCGGDKPPANGTTQATTGVQDAAPPLPQGDEPFALDPGEFVARIDNRYWPMPPGATWVYREVGEEGTEQRVEVTVTDDTKVAAGIEATVVHDLVTRNGELVEDTHDRYAQDRRGNVWYLGENTKEYEAGEVVSTAGSWEAGVNGALAGVIMLAFDDVLVTEDTTPLQPDVREHKYYAPGVGPVLTVDVAGTGGREELLSFEPGG